MSIAVCGSPSTNGTVISSPAIGPSMHSPVSTSSGSLTAAGSTSRNCRTSPLELRLSCRTRPSRIDAQRLDSSRRGASDPLSRSGSELDVPPALRSAGRARRDVLGGTCSAGRARRDVLGAPRRGRWEGARPGAVGTGGGAHGRPATPSPRPVAGATEGRDPAVRGRTRRAAHRREPSRTRCLRRPVRRGRRPGRRPRPAGPVTGRRAVPDSPWPRWSTR
jgi:hypothetical protein